MFVVSFFFFGDTLISDNNMFGVMPCNLSFIFEHLIICKTVIYIDKKDNSLWHVLVLSFDTKRLSRLVSDLSVEKMNPDMTSYRMLLDILLNGYYF
jgi:hypothetical protein